MTNRAYVWQPQFWGLGIGPIVCAVVIYFFPESAGIPAALLAGVLAWTVIWWLTEPLPIAITAVGAVLLCFILQIPQSLLIEKLPAGAPVNDDEIQRSALRALLAPFADPVVFFLLGGMFLGLAMHRHGLDRRFALTVLCWPGMSASPLRILLTIGLITALVSTVVSNTAATAIILPITLQICQYFREQIGASTAATGHFERYRNSLLLMTAYAASVGGIVTPIGTTTNIVAIGFFKRAEFFGREADFSRWMLLGTPLAIVLFSGLLLCMGWHCRKLRFATTEITVHFQRQKRQLGSLTLGEFHTLFVFLLAMIGWVGPGICGLFAPSWGATWNRNLPEEWVALAIPVLLYLLPTEKTNTGWRGALSPEDINRLDWGSILLFGAGLALGTLVRDTGLAQDFAEWMLAFWPRPGFIELTILAVFAGILLSEFTSNAAAIVMLIPIFWSVCAHAEIDPLAPMLGLTFGASFGSALPVSTPPNTLVYGTGQVDLRQMITMGVIFDLLCWICVSLGVIIAIYCGYSPFR